MNKVGAAASKSDSEQRPKQQQDDRRRKLVLLGHSEAEHNLFNEKFEAARAAIFNALGTELVLCVEHIGSSSVPGLACKPIIDILVGLRRYELTEEEISKMTSLRSSSSPSPSSQILSDLQYKGEYGLHRRHYFSSSDLHVHCYPVGEGQFNSHLVFRDFLQAVPEAVDRYAAHKRELAAKFDWDRQLYQEHKDKFVAAMIQEAFEWKRNEEEKRTSETESS